MQHVDLIAEYLLQLQRELAGVDAAVAHDALVDAEAHLRAAVAAGKTPAAAVDEFGTASDFARAYAGAPALVDPSAVEGAGATRSGSFAADRASSRTGTLAMLARMPVLGVWFQARAWSSLFYFLLPCFVIALATFVWVVCVGSLALGTLPIIVGVPLAVFLLGSVRAICLAEGKVVEFFLGVRMPRRVQPVQVLTPLGAVAQISFWQRIGCWLTDVRSWLSLGYILGNFFVATFLFSVFVTLVAVVVALLAVPVGHIFDLPVVRMQSEDPEVWFLWQRIQPDANGVVHLSAAQCLLSGVLGLALATGTLWLARGTGWVYGQVVKAIQVAKPQAVAQRFAIIQ
jgi:uncharacterized membrane protein